MLMLVSSGQKALVTRIAFGKGVFSLLGSHCQYAKSVNTHKKEKKRYFDILLEEIHHGGLSQLIRLGGTRTPNLQG